MVDEYQDVSPLQQRLLDLWLGDRDDLCVVGDASQTIYSFTGATPDHLLDFRTRHPGRHRGPAGPRLPLHPPGGRPGQRAARPRPAAGPPSTGWSWSPSARPAPSPVYTEYADEPAEAEGAARRIRDLVAAGVPAGEIAVLFRINAQSEVYEQALADAGVPYVLRGAERFFERPEVREAGVAAARRGPRGGNDPLLDDAVGPALPGAGRARPARAGPPSRRPAPARSASAGSRWPRWSRLAEDFAAAKPGATLADLVAELDERAAAQHAPTVEGVTLASLHAAKGLEWDAVFLVGLAEGMMPITYAKTDEQIEEERRLLYVGVTRARQHLSLSWALSRSPGGRAEPPAQPLPRRAAPRLGGRPAPWRGPAPAGGVERGFAGAATGRPAAAPDRGTRPAAGSAAGR